MKYIYTNKKRLPKNSTIEHNMFKCMCWRIMQCTVDDIKVNAINIQLYTQHINAEYNIQFTLKFTYYRRRGVKILPLLEIYYFYKIHCIVNYTNKFHPSISFCWCTAQYTKHLSRKYIEAASGSFAALESDAHIIFLIW